MKILFSPSEAKSAVKSNKFIDKDSFIFPELYDLRIEILNQYNEFLKRATTSELSKLFGLKNLEECENLREDIFKKSAIKAVLRYEGVAYKHLNYKNLDTKAQNFIDKNVMIFSNLFGGILAGDEICEYKLKQGEKIDKLNIEKFYKEHFSLAIDNWLKDDDILDLRAEFYEKFYEIKKPFTTFKFIKNGKVVSHYAKAYRGIILREIAKARIETIDELSKLNLENLMLIDIKKNGFKNEFYMQIL
ncbi:MULTISPECIES: YaaA family protein [unclassified Campylobacter]|uniref:YaaA family protein n=1 Tax=unclassified Campylobacter TaxID=2593542 RepID=UPI0014727602|nr:MULTISPECIES: YaaA family protein [unclassified Campylobacter]